MKSWYGENINKIDHQLTNFIKKKEKELMDKIRNDKEEQKKFF